MIWDIHPGLRILFGTIASLALSLNLLFCALILRSKSLVKSQYNTMVFALALSDMITGFCTLLTPSYIIGGSFPYPRDPVPGTIFCYLYGNHYMMVSQGLVSVYTVTLLSIERWFAVFRPLLDRCKIFRSKRVRIYLFAAWVGSFAANSPQFLLTKYNANTTHPVKRCSFIFRTSPAVFKAVGILEFLVKFCIPVLVMIVSFTSLYNFMRRSTRSKTTSKSRLALFRVTRMAALTAGATIVCWTPTQLYYVLFKFGRFKLNTPWHFATAVLCTFNSCLNPCIFLFSNKVYRCELRRLLPNCSLWHRVELSNRLDRRKSSAAVICTGYETRGTNMLEMK